MSFITFTWKFPGPSPSPEFGQWLLKKNITQKTKIKMDAILQIHCPALQVVERSSLWGMAYIGDLCYNENDVSLEHSNNWYCAVGPTKHSLPREYSLHLALSTIGIEFSPRAHDWIATMRDSSLSFEFQELVFTHINHKALVQLEGILTEDLPIVKTIIDAFNYEQYKRLELSRFLYSRSEDSVSGIRTLSRYD